MSRLPTGPESLKEELEELNSQRTLFTDEEFLMFRSSLLDRFACPGKFEWGLALPAIIAVICGLLGVAGGAMRWRHDIESGGLWILVGSTVGGLGTYLLIGYIFALRNKWRTPSSSRLAELDEVYNAKLIAEDEYAEIREKITSRTI